MAVAVATPPLEEQEIHFAEMLELAKQCEQPEDTPAGVSLNAEIRENVHRALADKMYRYKKFFNWCDADAAELDQEIKRLQRRKAAVCARKERVRKRIAAEMHAFRIEEINAQFCTFRLNPAKSSLQVDDASKLPDHYIAARYTTYEVHTEMLKRALENGEILDGACLTIGDPYITVT